MNRQQAPQPVVRPLQRLSVNGVIPVLEQDGGSVICVIRNSVNNKDTLFEFLLDGENNLQGSAIYCSREDDNFRLIDPSNVVNETLIRELPCYTGFDTFSDVYNAATSIMQTMVEGTGKVVSEFTIEERESYEDIAIKYVIEL